MIFGYSSLLDTAPFREAIFWFIWKCKERGITENSTWWTKVNNATSFWLVLLNTPNKKLSFEWKTCSDSQYYFLCWFKWKSMNSECSRISMDSECSRISIDIQNVLEYLWMIQNVLEYILIQNVLKYLWIQNVLENLWIQNVLENLWIQNVLENLWMIQNILENLWIQNVLKNLWMIRNDLENLWMIQNVLEYLWIQNVLEYPLYPICRKWFTARLTSHIDTCSCIVIWHCIKISDSKVSKSMKSVTVGLKATS